MNPENQIEVHQSLLKSGPRFGYRHVFGLLGFLGFLNVYAMRVNLSVAIVAMVNSTATRNSSSSTNITNTTGRRVPETYIFEFPTKMIFCFSGLHRWDLSSSIQTS